MQTLRYASFPSHSRRDSDRFLRRNEIALKECIRRISHQCFDVQSYRMFGQIIGVQYVVGWLMHDGTHLYIVIASTISRSRAIIIRFSNSVSWLLEVCFALKFENENYSHFCHRISLISEFGKFNHSNDIQATIRAHVTATIATNSTIRITIRICAQTFNFHM